MKILLIGGSGFIGSHLVEIFCDRGHHVSVFDRFLNPNYSLSEFPIEQYQGELSELAKLEDVIKGGYDLIVHLASTTTPQSSNDSPSFDVTSNLLGTISLLELCVKHRIPKFIFISSGGAVYGNPSKVPVSENHPTNPISSYGIVKLAIEKYLEYFRHNFGLNSTTLRLSNPYGIRQNPDGNQGAVAIFSKKILLGEEITLWGDGGVIRDFIAIEDVAELIYLAATSSYPGGIFNVGSGVGTSIKDLILLIASTLGVEAKINCLPPRLFDVPRIVLDPSKAMDQFSWAPRTSLEDGIQDYCKSIGATKQKMD